MVDRVFNRSPTPGRVQSFLPAVCSAHINMFAIQVVLLGSWLSGDSFLPLPSVGSPRIFTYFQAVVIVFLFSVEGAPLRLADIICGVMLRPPRFFAEFTEVIPGARGNQSICGKGDKSLPESP